MSMQNFVVTVFILCVALPFAFYVCCTVLRGKPISARLLKIFGMLLVVIFVLALAATDVHWLDALGGPLLGILTRWIK